MSSIDEIANRLDETGDEPELVNKEGEGKGDNDDDKVSPTVRLYRYHVKLRTGGFDEASHESSQRFPPSDSLCTLHSGRSEIH